MEITERHYYRMLVGTWSSGLILGFGLGLGTGLLIVKKRLETKYDEIAKREIAEAKQFYSILHKKDDYDTPESAVESLGRTAAEAIVRYQGAEPTRVVEDVSLVDIPIDPDDMGTMEVVDGDPLEDFDYDEEIKNRVPGVPYVISHDEYMEAESEHSQVTVTYFEGDGVLIDERDQPIDDIDETVGLDNLERFGVGSKDNKIVYIRNDKLDIDFEVVQSMNKYSEEVLGFVEHSDKPGARRREKYERRSGKKDRRFRGDDE